MAAFELIKEIGVPVGKARYGIIGGVHGFSHIQGRNGIDGMVQVNALLRSKDKTGAQPLAALEAAHIRGVNPAEFNAIALALTS